MTFWATGLVPVSRTPPMTSFPPGLMVVLASVIDSVVGVLAGWLVVALAAPATDSITATPAAVAATARMRDARMVFLPNRPRAVPAQGSVRTALNPRDPLLIASIEGCH